MFFFSNRKKEQEAAQRAEHIGVLPYKQPPKCGVYLCPNPSTGSSPNSQIGGLREGTKMDGSALVCDDCGLNVQATSSTVHYELRCSYSLSTSEVCEAWRENVGGSDGLDRKKARKKLVFYFPFSECGGGTDNFTVRVNGHHVFGTLMRARRRDGALISSAHKAAFLGETSDMSGEEEEEGGKDIAAGVAATTTMMTAPADPEDGKDADQELDKGDQEEAEASISKAVRKAKRTAHLHAAATVKAKLLYYYVVDDLSLVSRLRTGNATSAGATHARTRADNEKLHVLVSWRTKLCRSAQGVMEIPFAYYCAPRVPDRMSYRIQFTPVATTIPAGNQHQQVSQDEQQQQQQQQQQQHCVGMGKKEKIRVVRSPNCRGGVMLQSDVRESSAEVRVKTILGDALSVYKDPKDYLFVLQVYLGDAPRVVEEISQWGVVSLLLIVAWGVWYVLTKDLEL